MGLNETPQQGGYEKRDISAGAVTLFAFSLIATLIVVHYFALGIFHQLARESSPHPPASPLAVTRENFTGPRLLVNQKLDMEAFRTSEDVLLNNYEWVDRKHGVVRIPINRAMEMLVQRGTPP